MIFRDGGGWGVERWGRHSNKDRGSEENLPTSGVTMGVLGLAGLSWEKWARWMLPILLFFLVLALLLLIPTVVFHWQ